MVPAPNPLPASLPVGTLASFGTPPKVATLLAVAQLAPHALLGGTSTIYRGTWEDDAGNLYRDAFADQIDWASVPAMTAVAASIQAQLLVLTMPNPLPMTLAPGARAVLNGHTYQATQAAQLMQIMGRNAYSAAWVNVNAPGDNWLALEAQHIDWAHHATLMGTSAASTGAWWWPTTPGPAASNAPSSPVDAVADTERPTLCPFCDAEQCKDHRTCELASTIHRDMVTTGGAGPEERPQAYRMAQRRRNVR